LLTSDRLESKLKDAVEKAGGIRKWASANGISHSYVVDVMGKKRGIGKKMARLLGYKPVVMYVPDRE